MADPLSFLILATLCCVALSYLALTVMVLSAAGWLLEACRRERLMRRGAVTPFGEEAA